MKILETHTDGAPARLNVGGIDFVRKEATTMTPSIQSIEDSARAATPGPWGYSTSDDRWFVQKPSPFGSPDICEMSNRATYPAKANAAFIALCNPATVLALTARIAALEGALTAVLDTSGARGSYQAMKYGDAVELAEAVLARALQTGEAGS